MTTSIKAFFGDFNMPVKARRIVKQRKYSDVVITKPGVGRITVAASRPVRLNDWEPENVTKK